jgi:hypothetical protein
MSSRLSSTEQICQDDLVLRLNGMGIEPVVKAPGTSYIIVEKAMLKICSAARLIENPPNKRKARDLEAAWLAYHRPQASERDRLNLILPAHCCYLQFANIQYDPDKIESWRAAIDDPLSSHAPASSLQLWASLGALIGHPWGFDYNPIFVNQSGLVFQWNHDRCERHIMQGHGTMTVSSGH